MTDPTTPDPATNQDTAAAAAPAPPAPPAPTAGGLVDVPASRIAEIGHGCLADEGAQLLKALVAEVERLPGFAALRAAIASGKGARVSLTVQPIA